MFLRAKILALLAFTSASLTGCDLSERAFSLAAGEEKSSEPERSPDVPIEQAAGVSTHASPSSQVAPKQDAIPSSVEPPSSANPPAGVPRSFADLAASSNPGVVFVRTVKSTRRGFRRVLGESSGSGFIFDPSGKILTNYHVIKDARAIQVELQDGRTLMANIVGADALTDLAILQVSAQGLAALALGDSKSLRVGDWVIAIGNPFGLEHTVSAGIISAKERTGRDVNLGNPDAYYSFLQTDASINPGNSGGPLLDLQGQVVGINTAINQEANNIGFAIPINMIKRLLPRLLKDGHVKRAAIGVQVSEVTTEAIARFSLKSRRGALIQGVSKGGPAFRAGLMAGDVVIDFDGHAIATPDELRWNASLSTIDEEVSLTVIRGGREKKTVLRPTVLRSR